MPIKLKFCFICRYEEIASLPKVGNTFYYEVDTSLKEAFTAFTERPFSLLASFANPDVPLEAGISNDGNCIDLFLIFQNMFYGSFKRGFY